MKQKSFECQVGSKTLTATFSDLADQANGSVILRLGDTAVLVTAVMGGRDKSDMDYFPLTVDYEERFYAAGAILGSRFVRREGRPSDDAVLSGRVVDRTIRPLFDQRVRREVQVVTTVLSIDEDDPDVLGIIAASLALATSDIPWAGPVSAVRIGKKKGSDELVVNPNYKFRNEDDTELDLLVCGKDGMITMVEVGAKQVAEAELEKSFAKALEVIAEVQTFQKKLVAEMGKPKQVLTLPEPSAILAEIFDTMTAEFEAAVFSGEPGNSTISAFTKKFTAAVAEKDPAATKGIGAFMDEKIESLMDKGAIEQSKRVDGRGMDDLRPLFAQAGGISPILHGSGIFYRGGTHIFSALTLGGPGDSQIIDSIESSGEEKKRFLHHYNFPPFSVGETGRIGGMNRRMIGHGALAEKALSAVIPPKETFPYTIRLVSEAFASNGSTSMGSVCASILALMDGGVPITAPVAGIAMGVIYENENRYAILTDIQGPEDHYGDMDFKVAGTADGVTAIQLDVKVHGVPLKVLTEALGKARAARLKILKVMTDAIATSRADLSPRAPKIVSLTVPVDMIGMVIGPSGKNIKKIQEESGVEDITIEDDGSIFVTGKADAPEKAAQMIRDMTRVWKAGDTAEGPVTRIMDFGAFVHLGGKTEGLVHISEFAPFRIANVRDAVAIGEVVKVMVKEIDDMGRVNLSIKAIDPDFAARKGLKPAEGGGPHHDDRRPPPHHRR
jgi:polyribonucleotide nucleotidyltransferase